MVASQFSAFWYCFYRTDVLLFIILTILCKSASYGRLYHNVTIAYNDITASAAGFFLQVSVTCDLIYFDGTEVRGASKVGVVVKHGANIRTVNFRVWIPQLPLDVFLSDAKLSAVRGWKIASPAVR